MWMKDPQYAAAFEEARQRSVEVLETEARTRAVEGWDEPVYQNGQLVGWKKKKSDPLLMFLLEAWEPKKYKRRTENLNINAEVTPKPTIDVSALSTDEVRQLEILLTKLAGDKNAPADPA